MGDSVLFKNRNGRNSFVSPYERLFRSPVAQGSNAVIARTNLIHVRKKSPWEIEEKPAAS